MLTRQIFVFLFSTAFTFFWSADTRASGFSNLLSCEAILLNLQKYAPHPSVEMFNARAAILALREFRQEVLPEVSEADGSFAQIAVENKTVSDKDKQSLAIHINGLESRFANRNAASDDGYFITGFHEKGPLASLQSRVDERAIEERLKERLGKFRFDLLDDQSLHNEFNIFHSNRYDRFFEKAERLDFSEVTLEMISSFLYPQRVAGKWIFTSTTYPIRKETLDAIFNSNGDLHDPRLQIQLGVDAALVSTDLLKSLQILFTTGPNVFRQLYSKTLIEINTLIRFRKEDGSMDRTVIVQGSAKKSKNSSRKKKNESDEEFLLKQLRAAGLVGAEAP